MFTLGNKEIIINSSSKFKTEVNTINGTDQLTIQGYGSFEENQVLSIVGQRFIAPINGGLEITVPFATELGIEATEINVPVKVHIRVNTTRHTSEWATDFIKRGRPFIFEILVDGGDSDAEIAAKLVAIFVEYENRFNIAAGLPFSWTISSEIITLTLKSSYLSFQNYVVFLPKDTLYGVQAITTQYIDSAETFTGVNALTATTINVSDTAAFSVGSSIAILDTSTYYTMEVTDVVDATTLTVAAPGLGFATTGGETLLLKAAAEEPTFDGKYLEENVRLSTRATSDTYGISPDEKPIITGDYTAVTFTCIDTNGGISSGWKKHSFLGTTRGAVGENREFTFTIYFLEGTDLFTDLTGKVWDIVDFLITHATTSDLKIGNGTTVATASDFVNA